MFYMGSIFSVMRKVRSGITFCAGVLVGMNLSIVGYAYATEIIATLSTQPIYVDGEQVEMTAYSIEGNNYVRLRDIGEAVGFDVSWNSVDQCVEIDSDSPYIADDADVVADVVIEDSAPKTVAEMVREKYLTSTDTKIAYQVTVTNQTIAGKLSNGEDPTEENIRAMLEEIIEIYPQYTSWGATYNDGDLHWYEGTTGCNSYTYMVRDILYGTECVAVSTDLTLTDAKVGDIVYLKNNSTGDGHWMVVSELDSSSAGSIIYSMSGNSNAMVYVDAPLYLETILSRYPDYTIYRYY